MPNNWKTYKLTELVENIVDNRGKTCPTDVTGIPLIATNCIRNEKLYPDFINVRYVSDETYNNWFRAHPKPDDMLFVLKGTPGRVCWTPNPINFCIAQDMVALRAKKDIIYPKYLFALLRSKIAQDKINALHVGSLIPHFKKTDFDKLELPVFEDINYQKEIGNIYFDICDKIENNLAINKTLEEMAMALYKHWFVDFGPFQDGEFVESELGRIPKGWEVKSVYDIANYINGAAFKPSELVDEGKYVIKISELNGGITKNTGKSNKEVKPEQIINNGSVLFSWSATLDIFLWDKGEALLNQHIFNVLPNGSLSIEILYFLLKNIIAHFKAIAADRATTMGHIKISHLKETFLAIPNKNHKQEFQKIIEPIFNQILENLTENQTLTQLRDTLLPKLISGEVRLKEFRESITN